MILELKPDKTCKGNAYKYLVEEVLGESDAEAILQVLNLNAITYTEELCRRCGGEGHKAVLYLY